MSQTLGRSDLLPDSSICRAEFEVPSSPGGDRTTEVTATSYSGFSQHLNSTPAGPASIGLNRSRAPYTARMAWKHHHTIQLPQDRPFRDAPSTRRDRQKQTDLARSSPTPSQSHASTVGLQAVTKSRLNVNLTEKHRRIVERLRRSRDTVTDGEQCWECQRRSAKSREVPGM